MVADSKKFFWLKLKDDFFSQREVKKLRKVAGGDTFTIIYLKLQLLSIKSECLVKFEGTENDICEQLAFELDEDVENVKLTINFLLSHKLVEINDNEDILVKTALELVGAQSSSTDRVRRFRENKKALQCNADVTQCNAEPVQSNTEIEKDIEIDIEIDIEKEKESVREKTTGSAEPSRSHKKKSISKNSFGQFKNVKLSEEEYDKLKSELPNLDEVVAFLDDYIEEKGYKSKSHYLAIRRWVIDAVAEKKGRGKGHTLGEKAQKIPNLEALVLAKNKKWREDEML